MVVLSHSSVSHVKSMGSCLSLRMDHLILRLIISVIIFEHILPIIIVIRLLFLNHFSILVHASISELYFTFIECLYKVLVHSVLASFRLFLEMLLPNHLIILFLMLPVLLLISLLILILDELVLILRVIVVTLLLLILVHILFIFIASSHGVSSLISLNVHIVSLLVSIVHIVLLILVIVCVLRLVNLHFLLICSLAEWVLLIFFFIRIVLLEIAHVFIGKASLFLVLNHHPVYVLTVSSSPVVAFSLDVVQVLIKFLVVIYLGLLLLFIYLLIFIDFFHFFMKFNVNSFNFLIEICIFFVFGISNLK